MPQVNFLAVGAAAVAAFVLASVWYSPLLFFKPWKTAVGLSDEVAAKASTPLRLVATFVLVLIGALVFAFFLGPKVTPVQGALYGFAAGLTWVAFSLGVNYLFEGRPLKLFLINGGYHTLEFTLIGLILGLWH
ncbi:MAG TPA: DUF1761 domain-containing protein [Caulobacteraceae bacterium]|nr:DUF1761 domain-containing protein [Caulobacteraceae bacterium]